MSTSVGHTLVDESDAAVSAESPTLGPALVLVLEGERPSAASARYDLASASTVVLGRGERRAAFRPARRHHADLEVQVPDLRMSGRHALLSRVRGQWILEDSNSRNGTKVNGEPVEQRRLENADIVELGRTVFLFLTEQEPGLSADEDTDPTQAQGPDLPKTLHPALSREFTKLRKLAPREAVNILLLGESGTGKEVLARQVNTWSGRAGEFVGVNCAAISETLMESELFGSVRGAFSGATHDRIGLVRSADGGTLFLDEIADLPHASQAALLRVLQEREVLAVGAHRPTSVNIRVVAATHQDLDEAVAAGRFRQDLYARLAGFQTRLWPLRDRPMDIGILIAALLPKLADHDVRFSPEAIRAIVRHDWPLNIRELSNCLNTAITLAGRDPVALEHLPHAIRVRQPDGPAAMASPVRPLSTEQEQHRLELVELLKTHKGNVSAVAREVSKARAQVQRWLKRYGLNANDFSG